MTSTATTQPAHTPTAPDAVGPEPTYAPETAEGGPVTPTAPLAPLVAAGGVRLYRQRGTGSLRALPYLAPGSPARETAEYLAELAEEGATVAQLAIDTGLSKATVRRAIENLALAEDIEAGDYDDLVEPELEAVILAADTADVADES